MDNLTYNKNELPLSEVIKLRIDNFPSNSIVDSEKFNISSTTVFSTLDYFQFILFPKGKAFIEFGENVIKLTNPLLLILHPRETVTIQPDSPINIYTFCFSQELFDGKKTNCTNLKSIESADFPATVISTFDFEKKLFVIPSEKYHLFKYIFKKMQATGNLPFFMYTDYMKLYISELLMNLTEISLVKPAIIQNESLVSNDSKMVQSVISYIETNYQSKLTYEELASVAYVSRSKLYSCFKAEVGKTIGDYIKYVRINRACELLSKTKKSVYEIMLETGYNDMKLFCRRFKENVAMTPSEYRKLYNEYEVEL